MNNGHNESDRQDVVKDFIEARRRVSRGDAERLLPLVRKERQQTEGTEGLFLDDVINYLEGVLNA